MPYPREAVDMPLINTFLNAKPLTEDEYLGLSKKGLEILENEERWRTMHGLPLT